MRQERAEAGGGSAMLTPKQEECLLLVREGRTSKEIARQLGISIVAVNERLDRARSVLGAATRQEAARIYVALATHERIMHDPATIALPRDSAAVPASAEAEQPEPLNRVREMRSTFGAPEDLSRSGLVEAIRSIEPHDLGTRSRLALTLMGALAMLMVFGGLSLFLYLVVAIGRVLLG
jgi:DNA-binding CsgD family transcriptional regulator